MWPFSEIRTRPWCAAGAHWHTYITDNIRSSLNAIKKKSNSKRGTFFQKRSAVLVYLLKIYRNHVVRQQFTMYLWRKTKVNRHAGTAPQKNIQTGWWWTAFIDLKRLLFHNSTFFRGQNGQTSLVLFKLSMQSSRTWARVRRSNKRERECNGLSCIWSELRSLQIWQILGLPLGSLARRWQQ